MKLEYALRNHVNVILLCKVVVRSVVEHGWRLGWQIRRRLAIQQRKLLSVKLLITLRLVVLEAAGVMCGY